MMDDKYLRYYEEIIKGNKGLKETLFKMFLEREEEARRNGYIPRNYEEYRKLESKDIHTRYDGSDASNN